MRRMSTIYSRLSYGTGTTLTGCGVSAKAYAETAKTTKEVSGMCADRITDLSLSDNSPCENPADILRQTIDAGSLPGDLIADFFMGSGSTVRAAISCGTSNDWCGT